jgi:hypothetical protein
MQDTIEQLDQIDDLASWLPRDEAPGPLLQSLLPITTRN